MIETVESKYVKKAGDSDALREEMKKIQGKIKTLVGQGKSLEDVKKEFDDNHARLVESIFNEIKK